MNEKAKKVVAPFQGHKWRTAPEAAKIFSHVPAALPVEFVDPEELAGRLRAGYYDELVMCMKCLSTDRKWVDEDLVPIAEIGCPPRWERPFAWLFFDAKNDAIIYATTDEWSRENVVLGGLGALGLTKA
jgi:hypothetical protein